MATRREPTRADAQESSIGASFDRMLARAAWTVLALIAALTVIGWLVEPLPNWSLDDLAAFSQAVLAFFAVLTFVLAIWYGIETYKIRKYTESQVALLREQVEAGRLELQILQDQERLRVAPYLFGFVFNRENYCHYTDASDDDIPAKAKYFAGVDNLSPNLATNVEVFMYDREYKHFLSDKKGREFVREGERTWFTLTAILSETELLDRLNNNYLLDAKTQSDLMKFSQSENFLVVCFAGLDGQEYAYLREFSFDEEGMFSAGYSARRLLRTKQP